VRQDFKPPFDTTPGISRRTALCVAGTGVAYFATGYPAACAMGKPAPGGDGPRVERQSMHERHSRVDRHSDRNVDVGRQPPDLAALLAMGERAPRCEFGSFANGPLGTALAAGRATRWGADGHGHLSEKHNEKLASRGSDPLETHARSLLTKLPDGAKVSIGGQWGKAFAFGLPGKSIVFVNPTADYSNKASGYSLSIGGGPIRYGGVINFSYMDGRYEFSAGGYFAAPTGHAGQLSINLTDLFRGTLTFSEAASFPIVPSITSAAGIQVSIDVKPMEILRDAFTQTLGPLSDYRNFQSPMGDF
jgi:hypothetical protein